MRHRRLKGLIDQIIMKVQISKAAVFLYYNVSTEHPPQSMGGLGVNQGMPFWFIIFFIQPNNYYLWAYSRRTIFKDMEFEEYSQ